MKLLGTLYKATACTHDAGKIEWAVTLDAGHDIYRGHFPGNPITPGVVMLQMVRELLQEHIGAALALDAASNIKYAQVLTPACSPVNITVDRIKQDDGAISCRAAFTSPATGDAFARMSLIFNIVK